MTCTAYHRKKSKSSRDVELVAIGKYLVQLAQAKVDFTLVDFNKWRDVVAGNRELIASDKDEEGDKKRPAT